MSTRNRCLRAFGEPLLSLVLLGLLGIAALNGAALPAGAADVVSTNQDQSTLSEELLRSYLQLQEQLHSLQLSIEKNRQDTASAADKSAEQLAGRLNTIEQALGAQRARELEAMQSSNRVMLTVAGTFAGVGLLAMVSMAYFQWRTINRLAELSAALPSARLLGPGSAAWAHESHLLSGGAADQSNARLMGNLEQLEKRLVELEHTARTTHEAGELAQAAGAVTDKQNNGNGETPAPEAAEDSTVSLLLAKGQSFLNMDRAEDALGAFEEALKAAPNNTEVLLKRAAALERLGQLDAAIESCDRAIAADRTSTMAYLQKGGLYNRMERFEDAIQCYEAALRVRS